MDPRPPSRWRTTPVGLRESSTKPTCCPEAVAAAEAAAAEAAEAAAAETAAEAAAETAAEETAAEGLICAVERLRLLNPTPDPTLLAADADQAVNSTYWK